MYMCIHNNFSMTSFSLTSLISLSVQVSNFILAILKEPAMQFYSGEKWRTPNGGNYKKFVFKMSYTGLTQ